MQSCPDNFSSNDPIESMLQRWMNCFLGRPNSGAPREPEPFSLGDPLPPWPQGGGFAQGRIYIGGELELAQITTFLSICTLSSHPNVATFYKPLHIPAGFSLLGHYCQPNHRPLHGYVLVAKPSLETQSRTPPPLSSPQDYILVWCSNGNGNGKAYANDCCIDAFFWLPLPPQGYRALGFLVTTTHHKPSADEVGCVRADLTEECEPHGSLLNLRPAFSVRGIRPLHRGMWGTGVGIGTFCCVTDRSSLHEHVLACLKNVKLDLSAMPTLDQAHALIRHYGPTVFFHPKELYLPSSVSWFFKNGATLYKKGGGSAGEEVDAQGSSLPCGGCNDGEYWIDLPDGKRGHAVKRGDLDIAELYTHVKPALGGTCTDVAMWVFCPFNGPATLKLGMASIALGRTGQHVGDWEHFTLRISNFTGKLLAVYFSQHSGGEWVDAAALEYIDGNRCAVYSSKSGHASYPHPGVYLQGSPALKIGIKNDAARSKLLVDSSVMYQIVAAEYLGHVVAEPPWLQYTREWGPTVVYQSRRRLPRGLPAELSKEEGPTGPKEKNNWEGDERA